MAKVEKRGPRKITVLYPLPSTASNKDEKKQRVAAYCRVSSGSDEQLNSYQAQINHYEKHIKANPDYIFSGIYADEGISGTGLNKRDAFKRMLFDAREGKLDMVMVKSLSRFGRNTLDSLNSIRELKTLGVDVYFEKENMHTMQSEGEMLLTLISAVAENESFTMSENVKWGIRRKYERGNIKSIPSGKFLGYDKDEEGNLVINEEQAEVVRRIYQEFLDGYGTYQIAKRLTEEKVPMAFGGKEWHASHVKKVLTNEKFKGDTLFSKTFNADPLTKRRVKNTGQLPQFYFEDTHPAIIDKLTWELVQLEFKRQNKFCEDHHIIRYHNQSDVYPFAGRVICGICNHTFMQLTNIEGEKYMRCKTFLGKRWTIVAGREYTPPSPKSRTQDPKNEKRRKKPVPRHMFCTDIKIPAKAIESAFINAWNHLVDNPEKIVESEDALRAYRARELKQLIAETGCIDTLPNQLLLKTLDHIEIKIDGTITVVFLSGLRLI